MTAHLLTIGDEILIGQIVDTNSAWMSRQLNLQGIQITGKSSVSDTRDAIVSGLKHAATEADIIIMTGGLGPTKDDLTKKTLADIFQSDMRFHQEVLDRIEGYFSKIGRKMPDSIREQAMLPSKATVLINKVGTASGMWFDQDEKVYISLPGVPFEMEYLMEYEVLPRLKERFPGRPIVHRTVLTAGEGESAIAKRIEDFEEGLPENVKLAYLPALGQVRLRLSAYGRVGEGPEHERGLHEEVDRLRDQLVSILPDIVYGYDDESLPEAIGKILLQQGKTIGTAESCTGGYLAHLITSIPGSSAYYPGSVVTYSYEMKTKLLGVRPETLLQQGAVSEATVREMAEGALNTLGVDVALAISGIAGPDGGMPDKPVGTVWMAVADRDRTITSKHVFGRDRLKNIQMTGVYALNLVRKFLLYPK